MRAARLKLLSLAAVLCCSVAIAALAEDSEPAPLPANPLPGTPSVAAPAAAPAAAAPADLQSCLAETGDYVTHGKSVVYVIGLTNSCAKRLRCEIHANVSSAYGTSLGHTVMILGAASSGAAAKKSYGMPVKAVGGIAQVSRECKVL